MVHEKPDLILTVLLNILLIVALFTDIKKQKIPNVLTFPVAGTAAFYHFITGGADGLVFSVSGLAVGILLLIVPYVMGGMGAGDAKMMGAVGAILGSKNVFFVFLYTAVAGGIYAMLLILFHRRRLKGFFREKWVDIQHFLLTRQFAPASPNETGDRPKLCYGVAIAVGTYFFCMTELWGIKLIF